ncbi:class I SAM-dependent methyltransferase [Devosia sp. SL43]|nr:class I SAM-dependent methyltransferase [Devosia sp. SL43]
MTERAGASFEEADVVENYVFRPPYPDAIFARLAEISPARVAALDIGCGPGKVARPLTRLFGSVTAVDPSSNMIALGRSLPGGDAANIEWIEGFAEEFPIGERRFDLTVAAASIHWMDHQRLFPRLAQHGRPGHIIAVVSGDDAFEPPWRDEWLAFLQRWVPRITGEQYDPATKTPIWDSYRSGLDILGDEYFISDAFEQSVADFIGCQHSRDTFASSRLGPNIADFDRELEAILQPHADKGRLTYQVRTRLVWGTIRSAIS